MSNSSCITKWGVLATGRIAESFSAALRGNASSEPFAVASRTLEKAQSFAQKYGFSRGYGSYEELAADEDVDIIYIASPMSCHYENVKLCLSHGKNVLCEKSITLNSNELAELIALAREKNVFFMEAMWMKFLPSFKKALEWRNSGKIGTVRMVKADFCNTVPLDTNDRLFRKDLGGGAMLDLSVYTLTFAAAFLGNEPSKITAFSRMGATGVDFDNAITLCYENGAFAALTAGFDIPCDNRATVIGDKGRIEFGEYFFCTSRVRLCDDNGAVIEECELGFDINGYEYEIRESERCLRAGLKESPLNTLADTAAIMRIIDKAQSS